MQIIKKKLYSETLRVYLLLQYDNLILLQLPLL